MRHSLRSSLRPLALLALATACTREPAPGGDGSAAPAAPAPAPGAPGAPATVPVGPLPFERFRAEPYAFSPNSGYEAAERLVIRDAAAWEAAWARLHAGGSPRPLPAVDFTVHSVVLAALGQRASGGYGILLDSAVATVDSVIVHLHATSPGPRCGTTVALTEPVDLARIPHDVRPVAFRERQVVTDCP